MKRIELESLGLSVPVEDNVSYFNDGIVRDMTRYVIDLERKYGVRLRPMPFYKRLFDIFRSDEDALRKLDEGAVDSISAGKSIAIYRGSSSPEEAVREGRELIIHTAVRAGFSQDNSLFYQGHEETHALIDLGRLDLLKLALPVIKINSDNLESLPVEAICHVGGFYALYKDRGISEKTSIRPKMDENFEAWIKWMRSNSPFDIRFKNQNTS